MCGLVGLVGNGETHDRIVAMTQAVAHRGPDGQGIWQSDDGRVALGHRRLSIMDLSETASQPMRDMQTGVVLAFNGEIYNFRHLRKELQSKGFVFKGTGDTEVLLMGYLAWGDEVLQKLKGMFALAIYDPRGRRRILLARDRSGQKPLYFCFRNGIFSFASEIKSFFAGGMTGAKLDAFGLEEYLAYGYTMGPKTLITDVEKLLPGESAIFYVDSNSLSRERYWSVPQLDTHSAGFCNSTEDLDSVLEGLLSDAVARHLVADVPVAVLLSGGIDSSLLTAIAAKHIDGPLKTFTAIFPGGGRFDESEHARLVSRHFGTEHVELEIGRASPEIMQTMARQFDDPIADHAMIPLYMLSREIRQHGKVVLGGDGGDELFGGYPHHILAQKQHQLRRFLPGPIRCAVAHAARYLPIGMSGRNHALGLCGDLGHAIAHMNLYFDKSTRASLLGTATQKFSPEQKRGALGIDREDPVDRALYADFCTTLPEGYLAKLDRASMLASLEMRAPFLDDHLIEFAWRCLPPSMKVVKGQGKAPLKRLAKRLLPSDLNLDRKQGLTMPLGSWFEGKWGRYITEVLTDPSQQIFKRSAVEKLITLQRQGFANQNRLFSLAMLTLWLNEYGVAS